MTTPNDQCECGCGEQTRVYTRNYHQKDLRKGDHARFVKNHAKRLNYRVNDDGCWIWNGTPDRDGYAVTHWDGKTVKVYRAMYELLRGPISTNKVIDHRS